MKRILQAMDGISTKPVVGANDMSKFLKIVKEGSEPIPPMPDVTGIQAGQKKDLGNGESVVVNADGTVSYQGAWGTYIYNAQGQHIKTQSPSFAGYSQETDPTGNVTQQNYAQGPMSLQKGPDGTTANYQLGAQNLQTQVNEGANPHKVALPVQMAMQHYQQPKEKIADKPSLLKKYFAEAEEEIIQKSVEEENIRRQRINMYAQKIANRVLMKESALKNKEDLKAKRKALQDIQLDPNTHKDPELKAELARRKAALEKEAKEKKLDERIVGGEETPPGINRLTGKPIAPAPAPATTPAPAPADGPFAHFSNEYLQKAVDAMNNGVRMRLMISGPDAEAELKRRGVINETPIDMTGDPNDPHIYGHQKANPMSLKGRIMQARAQLKELAQAADSDNLAVWQDICAKAKGGMFMGLEQNLEQIRHGISELAAKRKQGGIQSRGIDKNVSERSVSKAQFRTMAAVANNPEFAKKVGIKSSVGKEFHKADKKQSYKNLPDKAEESLKTDNPCWDGYKPVGTKKKGGKTVPNCVPKD